jgi:hypothetical protein
MAYIKEQRKSQKNDNKKNSRWYYQNPQANGKVSFARYCNAQMHAESKGPSSSGEKTFRLLH